MSFFISTVTDAKGRVTKYKTITGSGHMTIEQFKQHIIENDFFPGAKSIEIQDLSDSPEGQRAQAAGGGATSARVLGAPLPRPGQG